MNIRKATSLTALASFVILIVTSVILYIVPHGRVAYWADWHLWGMTKDQWGAVHINTGVLFLVAIGLHVYYNWKLITKYLADKGEAFRLSAECIVALAVSVAFVAGTLLMVPPFSWILDANEYFKEEGALKYGEPPYGHAELSSLSTFASRLEIDLEEGMARLAEAGLAVKEPGQTVSEVASGNGLTPKQVHEIMAGPEPAAGLKPFPQDPPPGFGRRTLADVCAEYGLHPPAVLSVLQSQGIKAEAGLTVKEIAEENGVGPVDVFEAIRKATQ